MSTVHTVDTGIKSYKSGGYLVFRCCFTTLGDWSCTLAVLHSSWFKCAVFLHNCLPAAETALNPWMEVERTRGMGPERVLPSSEEELGQERVSEPAADEWSGEDGEEEDGAPGEEEEDSAGYYYQPLNQEPDGVPNTPLEQNDEATHADQLQEVQERIEVTYS